MNITDMIKNYQGTYDLKLCDGAYEYYVLANNAAAGPEDKTIRCSGKKEAEDLIERAMNSTGETNLLQNFLSKKNHGSVWSYSDKKLREQTAELIVNCNIVVVSRTVTGLGNGSFEEEKPSDDIKSLPGLSLPALGSSSAVFKLIEDQTGDPVPGVKLKITHSDDRFNERITAYDKITQENIKHGECGLDMDISSEFGATLTNTFAFVSVSSEKDKAAEESPNLAARTHKRLQPGHRKKCRHISVIKEHHVSEGESLSSIAMNHNSTFKDLAYFNWGTYDRNQVLMCMERDIGCSEKTTNGKEFVFTGNEDPGIIFIPIPSSENGLATDIPHTIRVKKLSYHLRYYYQIDLDDPEVKNDTIILLSDDKSWEYTLCLKDLEEIEEDWVELIFPYPPKGKTYSMIHNPGDEENSYYIFQNVSYDDLQFNEETAFDNDIFI